MTRLAYVPLLALALLASPARADPPAIPKSDTPVPAPKPVAPAVAAAPSLSAPATVYVDPGELFTVKATTNCKWVGFYAQDGGLTPFDLAGVIDGAKPKPGVYVGTVSRAARPGDVYRLFVYAGNATAQATPVVTRVVVNGPPPPPVPPVPPTPPPAPADPLLAALQAAYAGEADAGKAVSTATLADLLGAVVAAARASGKVTTTTQLEAAVHKAADLAVGPGKIMTVRTAVGAYLSTTALPKPGTASQPMTDALWATAAAEYAKVATALKGVK